MQHTKSLTFSRGPKGCHGYMLVSGSVPLFWTLCFSLEQVLEWPHVWFGCPKSANHHPATVNTMKSTLHDLSFLFSSILSREYYIISVPQCVFSVPRTSTANRNGEYAVATDSQLADCHRGELLGVDKGLSILPWWLPTIYHGNLRVPPPMPRLPPQEIAGLIKGLIKGGWHRGGYP